MASWRPVGVITPNTANWQLLPHRPVGNFFRLVCVGVPSASQSFIQFQEWRNQRPGPIYARSPLAEQCFEWGDPGERLVSVRKGYPLRAVRDQEDYQICLEEWVDDERPERVEVAHDFVQKEEPRLWLPGNH